MSLALDRSDTSILGRWWWTVDRWTILALLVLSAIGAVLIVTASPAVSERIGLDSFALARRQLVLLPVALSILFIASLLPIKLLRRLSILGFLGCLVLLVVTLIFGDEIKGATRWISILGFSIQPSELAKPLFAVTAAWAFSMGKEQENLNGTWIALALWVSLAGLLLLQPDLGQTFLVTAIFGVQFFLAGLPILFVTALALLGLGGLIAAYFLLPHATQRIDSFLNPEAGDNYQVERSLEAFQRGGLFGRGPGEGRVKEILPDAHADFVFAVAGEELGMIACIGIVLLFAFVVLRGFARLLEERNLFVLLAATGLLTQFGLQAIINMASTLRLMPTKGMTLPFLSYGGTSVLAMSLGMGLLLAFTRRRIGQEERL